MVFRGKTFALAPLLAATLWGGMYVISKWGFDAIPPVTLAFLRVVLGAAALLVVVRFVYPRRSFSRRDWRGFAVLGVWVTVTMVTQFVGTQLTTASQGALITVLTPVFTCYSVLLSSTSRSPTVRRWAWRWRPSGRWSFLPVSTI